MTDRELWQYALRTLISHQDMTRPLRETNDCIDKLETELAKLKQDAGKCVCGANLYIDENGKPCSKSLAQPETVVSFTDNEEGLWIQLECNGSYYSQNLSESKTAKFFVDAYRGRK